MPSAVNPNPRQRGEQTFYVEELVPATASAGDLMPFAPHGTVCPKVFRLPLKV